MLMLAMVTIGEGILNLVVILTVTVLIINFVFKVDFFSFHRRQFTEALMYQ